MFLTVVLPFVDFRPLQHDSPKLLDIPTWPAATALVSSEAQVFQRNFGKVIPRPLKGLPGWIGESDICQFRKSARVSTDGLHAKCVKKRLYFDGTYCGYVSFSFSVQGKRYGAINPRDAENLAKRILRLPVYSRHFPEGKEVILGESGDALSRAFALGGSSISSVEFSKTSWEPQTYSGAPIFFQEGRNYQPDSFFRPWQAFIAETHWLFYRYSRFNSASSFHCFVMPQESSSKEYFLRRSRIVLGRYYLEALFLKSVMRFILDSDLTKISLDNRNMLASRLNECLVRLYGRKQSRSGLEQGDYEEIRRVFVGLFDESRLHDLERSLRLLGARRNLRWLLASSDLFDDDSARNYILNMELDMTKEETHYHGPVGVAGKGSSGTDFTVNQDNRKVILGQDQEQLLEELGQLKLAIASEIDEPQSIEALRDLNGATKAIEADDAEVAQTKLKSAGKWALDKAEKIGVSVAAAAIKHTLGM